MKTYSGVRTENGCAVTVEDDSGESRGLDPRFDLRNHSPAGFEWGVRHVSWLRYPRFSREELERRFLGRPTHLEPKGRGESSLLVTRGTE
ncbi:MAG: hypothetical protein C0501_27740 [Isosphaera sp.]|nr:hypothetical protein [Isosphaera sp.]